MEIRLRLYSSTIRSLNAMYWVLLEFLQRQVDLRLLEVIVGDGRFQADCACEYFGFLRDVLCYAALNVSALLLV